MSRAIGGEAIRFLAAGAINTVATYAAYLVLLEWMTYGWAYSLTFVAGIGLSYLLHTRFVFRVAGSAGRFAVYPLIYAAQYAAGLGILHVAVAMFGMSERLALLASIAVSVPLTFILTRLLLKREGATAAS